MAHLSRFVLDVLCPYQFDSVIFSVFHVLVDSSVVF